MCAPVDERAPGAFDEDSIPFEQNKKTGRWPTFCFGGLEGDRTLEPHGCEPCALPSVTVITDRKQGSICQKSKESKKKGSKQGV